MRRRVLGEKEKFNIPSGYKRVNYLKSNGYSWIDTGIIPKANMQIEAKIKNPSKLGDLMVFGTEDNLRGMLFFGIGFGGKYCYGHGTVREHGMIAISESEVIVRVKNNKVYVDDIQIQGIVVKPGDISYFKDVQESMFLFDRNPKRANFTGRIYYFKNGNENYLIPCLDNNGIPCMYDVVTKRTFYSKGDSFAYG